MASSTERAALRRPAVPGWIVALPALLVGAWAAVRWVGLAAAAPELPRWDMAWNGWLGLELAEDLRQLRPFDFLLHLHRHDIWPFGTSLLLAPLFLLLGPGFATPLWLGAASLAGCMGLAVVVARQVEPGASGSLAGLLAAGLLLGSPQLALLSVLTLREIPGAFFTLAALVLYLRARRRGNLAAYRLAGLAALALLFVKANYGLVWLAAAVLDDQLRRSPAERRDCRRAVASWLWPRGSGSTGRWLLAAALVVLAALYLAGGSVGGPAYVLLIVLLVAWLRRHWGRFAALRAGLGSSPPEVRAAIETLVVPLTLWCLSLRHFKGLLRFLRNRSSELSLGDGLLFYPRALLFDYVSHPILGGAVLVLAVLGLVLAWRRGAAARTLAVLLGVQLISLLHPYKESRFAATAVPQVFLVAALAIVWLVGAPGRPVVRSGVRFALGVLGSVVGLAGLLGAAMLVPARDLALVQNLQRWSSPAGLRPVLDTLAEASAGARRVALLGGFDELSPWLLGWRLVQGSDTREVRVTRALRRFVADRPLAEAAARTDAWLAEVDCDLLLVLRLDAESTYARSDDFLTVNAWQQRAIAALSGLSGWREVQRRSFPEVGIEIEIWRPVDGGDR